MPRRPRHSPAPSPRSHLGRVVPPPAPRLVSNRRRPPFGAVEAPLREVRHVPRAQGGMGHPDGWYGLRGPTRFGPPPRAYQVGHGEQLVRPRPNRAQWVGVPAGTRFGVLDALRWLMDHIRAANEDVAALGTSAESATVRYHRGRPEFVSPYGNHPGMHNWTKDGPVPESINYVGGTYTARREFLQGAQTLSGMHTSIEPGAVMALPHPAMRAPVSSRLTHRAVPASYGSGTEVIGATGEG